MKSLFIEGTNKQYSIREDGKVIKHYSILKNKKLKYYDKVLKIKAGNTVSAYKIDFNINTLLLIYFKYKLCKECRSKIYKETKEYYCNICKTNNKRISNKRKQRLKAYYNTKHLESNINRVKKSNKYHIDNLSNAYLASLLRVKIDIIPNDIIKAKKQQMLLYREIKQQLQT